MQLELVDERRKRRWHALPRRVRLLVRVRAHELANSAYRRFRDELTADLHDGLPEAAIADWRPSEVREEARQSIDEQP
jgi:hypothetical protein